MATIVGTRYTWSDTANVPVDMSSALDVLRPVDTPLLRRIGRDSLRDPCRNVKHEWLEDELRGQTTNVVSGFDNTSDPVTVTITTGHESKFRAADVLMCESELVRVTSTGTNTITVTRGFGGSTPASHAATTLITLIAPALLQGAAVGAARTTTKTGKYNMTQIFEEAVIVTATEQAVDHYIKHNETEYQIGNHLEILGTNMEKALLFGKISTASSTVAGAMNGIRAVIATNVYNKASAALTQTMIEDALQDIWEEGAKASLIVCNATQKRRLDTFMDPYRQADYRDETFGALLTRYHSNFGDLEILMDRWMLSDEILILDPTKIGFGPLQGRALGITKITPTSREFDTWQMSGEYTCEVRQEKCHARLYGLATTGLF